MGFKWFVNFIDISTDINILRTSKLKQLAYLDGKVHLHNSCQCLMPQTNILTFGKSSYFVGLMVQFYKN